MHSIILERLQLILEHAHIIEERIRSIQDVTDLTSLKQGEILSDSLLTRLQALSENIKKIQKIDQKFFETQIKLDVTPIVTVPRPCFSSL